MREWILPLDSAQLTVANGGGKAANLSRLIRAGFSTPSGFVVTTEAYRHFVTSNNLEPVLATTWERIDPANVESYEAASRQIFTLFNNGTVPGEIRTAILAAYDERIPIDLTVAVRSSATAEDRADASFAGQQETYLGVVGKQAVLSAVVKCWASLWTARAMAYRMSRGIEPGAVSMAVVVQQMIPARMAGVLFTVNPVTGDPDEMVINATLGLGSVLVEGQITPDTFVADRETGDILEEKLADKAIMLTLDNGHLEEVDVESARRRKPSLTALHVSALVALGKQLEALFGGPQDVEWAIVRSRLYVLQSRPITATSGYLSYAAPGDDAWPPLVESEQRPFDLWTQADLGERWPEPLTPLTWSTWQPLSEQSMRQGFQGLNKAWIASIPWIKRAYGRAYLNEGALAHVLHEGYGMPATTFAEGLGSVPKLAQRYQNWRWGTVLRRSPLILRMTLTWDRQMKAFERDFPKIDGWVDDFMARNLREETDAALWAEARGPWQRRLESYIQAHSAVTSSSMNAYSQMESLLRHWAGDATLVRSLVVGLSDIIQAEIVPGLWKIANAVVQANLVPVLLTQTPAAALAELMRLPQGEPVLAQLAKFLQRHGHRCAIEAEWLHPRWAEDPAQVIAQVATYLSAGDSFDPQAAARQQEQRFEATRRVEKALNFFQRIYFRWGLRRLHRLVRMRDNGQHYLVKLALPVRRIYATLGERWAERDWLAQSDDFFFLVVPEIEAVVAEGRLSVDRLDLKRTVRERRLAWNYWMTHPDFPEILGADGKPVAAATPIIDGQVLTGIAASGGRIEGIARVISSPKDAVRLHPGEILVTRATDPGWTPVFSLIGGVVLEVGGQLSHGAIVAREYGLPAVVNVLGATRRIQDGQKIVVDGSAGKVFWY